MLALLPKKKKKKFLLDGKTLVIVMALNLGMGFMISGINNAAHIGGMLMGAAMTLIWYIGQRSKHSNLVNGFAMLLAPLGCAAFYW